MKNDKENITAALKLWFQEGDVFEIRVLDAVSQEWMRPHMESGYFDYKHIPDAAEAIGKLRSFRGAYATVNPVNPDLLARACNRLRGIKREATTADTDILSRRWLLIDCDPRRVSGVSSSDVEHEAAVTMACKIRSGLSASGWPDPILLDSGNGAQMMYRIDLPVADGGLVQRCIAGIATAGDDKVDVDLTVFNPARIWRIPGTMNCKGDDVPTRPHRMAQILSVPEKTGVVTPEQMEVAASWKTVSNSETIPCREVSDFDLDAWISRFCPELGQPQVWRDGRKWVFPVCPFNDAHRNRSAVLIQQSNGAIAFRCHHNSCAGNDWYKLRELRDPGCYDRKEQPLPDVDISGILAQKPRQEAPQTELPVEEPDTVPWKKLSHTDIRGVLKDTVLGEMCELLASVTNPHLPIEAVLPKALVLCGAALSEKADIKKQQTGNGNLAGIVGFGKKLARLRINTGDGQICNFYTLLAAPSGSGKDIGGLVDTMANYFGWFIGNSGSAEGLADAFIKIPNGILSISELQPFLDEKSWQHKATEFLTFAFNKGFFKQNFSNRGRGNGTREAQYCAPNVVAFVQPEVFESIAGITDLHSGLLGRFLFSVVPDFSCEANIYDNEKVVRQFAECIKMFRKKKGNVQVPLGYAHELNVIFRKYASEELSTCWRRLANEYYPRFAVVLSIRRNGSENDENVIITDDSWERAKILAYWFYGQAEKLLLRISDALPMIKAREKLLLKVFRKIRKLDKGDGVTLRDISLSGIRNSNGKERREALAELEERGLVCKKDNRYSIIFTPPEWTE